MAFTGDALLIRGCGRTDFQEGSSGFLLGEASVAFVVSRQPEPAYLKMLGERAAFRQVSDDRKAAQAAMKAA